jgi:hypothetical protein
MPGSVQRRVEVVRLSELSLELKRRIEEIDLRIAELKADIAGRPSGIQKPGGDSAFTS